MPDEDRDLTDNTVAEDATTDADETDQPETVVEADEPEVEAESADKRESPRLVDLETLKLRAQEATSVEGRKLLAMPFPLEALGIDVLVAPLNSPDLYQQLFRPEDGVFKGEDLDTDIELVRAFVLNCVVEPVLDDEALDMILNASPHEFNAVGKFALDMTMTKSTEKLIDRLGAMDTDAHELFLGGLPGRMSTPTPV